ncbi:MAG: radical SAM protein [bacterium]
MRPIGFAAKTLTNTGRLTTKKGYPSDILRLISKAYAQTARMYGPLAFGKVFNHPDRLKVFLSGRVYEPIPITWSLALSWVCNNACVLCTFGDRKFSRDEAVKGPKGLMTKQVVKTIIDQLAEYGAKAIIFTGGGEPTLHPDLLELMSYAKEKGLDVGLFTNGSFDPAWATMLLRDVKPSFVRVSLNAPDPVSHRIFHNYALGVDNFATAIGNIQTMAQYKFSHPEVKTNLGIGVIVGPNNVDALSGYGQLIRKLLFDQGRQTGLLNYIAFRPQVVYGGREMAQQPKSVYLKALTTFWSDLYPRLHSISNLRLIFVKDRFKMLYRPQQSRASFCVGQVFRGAIGLSRDNIVPREKVIDIFGQQESVWPQIFQSLSSPQLQFRSEAEETIYASLLNESRKQAAIQLFHQTRLETPAVFSCDEHNGDNHYKFGDLTSTTIEDIYRGQQREETLGYIQETGYPLFCPPTCIMAPTNEILARIMGYDLHPRHEGTMADRINRACHEEILDINFL